MTCPVIAIKQLIRPSKIILWILVWLFTFRYVSAQTSDEEFKKPLLDVLNEVQARYNVILLFSNDLVKDQYVTYAEWRFRPDIERTLSNILPLNDIVYIKEANGKYRLEHFAYHEKKPEEGLEQLKTLAGTYNTKDEWEVRKELLRSCIVSTLAINKFPRHIFSAPILTNKRIYKDYCINNFALETLPGVYICGSIYMPTRIKGKIPVVFNQNGHFERARYREDCQYRAATLARMGMISVTYDLFGFKGESILQVDPSAHYKSHIQPLQVISAMRIFDFVLSMKEADTTRVAITGASGGGSQSMLMSALDPRIKLSIPVVMMSSYFSGGCPCESGMGIHLCGEGTNNVEIAGMSAPKPQLIISDGQDWTKYVPSNDFPYLRRIYDFYGSGNKVENVHLEAEGHDYGINKRQAMYAFIVKYFHLNPYWLKNEDGSYSEKGVVIENDNEMKAFGADGVNLPSNALKGWDKIESMIKCYMNNCE